MAKIPPKAGTRRRVARTGGLLVAVFAGLVTGCAPTSLLITPVATDRSVHEIVVAREGAFASKRIAIIDVEGLLSNDRDRNFLTGVEGDNKVAIFKEKLDKAANDRRVKAIVLRINTPGGGVTASDLMYQELRSFRGSTGKPIIAAMLDLGTSGGYYIACAADKIYAAPTTVTGSIGVIMLTVDLTGTLQKIGADVHTFKSGEMKDAGSPFREMTERDERVFQHLIDEMYARFLEVVQRGRPQLAPERLRELADGRVYLAPDALEHGLIDGIGTVSDAISAAKSAAGIADDNVVVVQYARSYAHRPNYYATAPAGPPQVNILNLQMDQMIPASSPRFMYLWMP